MAGLVTMAAMAVLAVAVGEGPDDQVNDHVNDHVVTEVPPVLVQGHCDDGRDNCTEFSNVHVLTLGDSSDSSDTDDVGAATPRARRAGFTYSGERSSDGLADGIGVMSSRGALMTGMFVNGALEGQGTIVWARNGSYTGRFKANLPHGRGRYTGEDGAGHWGDWRAGQRQGLGMHVGSTADGSPKTFAEFDSDVMLGNGVEIPGNLLADASNGGGVAERGRVRKGQGLCTFENGDAYVGQWRAETAEGGDAQPDSTAPAEPAGKEGDGAGSCAWEDVPSDAAGLRVSFYGAGLYKYANGDFYAGEWKNMLRQGRGTYVGVDGGKYAGEWHEGKYHGVGTLQLPGDKGVQAGHWYKNKFLGDGWQLSE